MHNAKSLSGYFRYKEVGYAKPVERATYFMFLSTRYIVFSEKSFSVVYVSKKKKLCLEELFNSFESPCKSNLKGSLEMFELLNI